jgi:DNA replication licensing factor MCM3
LSPKVQESDAKEAEAIMRFALFKEVLKRQRRKKRKLNNGAAAGGKREGGEQGSDDETDGEDTGDEQDPPERMSMPPKVLVKAIPKRQPSQVPSWAGEGLDLQIDEDQLPAAAGPTEDGKIRPERWAYSCF